MRDENRMLTADQGNTGHGHVFPRPDGVRARCGGPLMCTVCAADLARQKAPLTAEESAAYLRSINAVNNMISFTTMNEIAKLIESQAAHIAELERERDLAIAHDRQPYPTADAYEAVCRADQAKRVRIAELEKIIARDDTTTSYKCSECGAWHLRKVAAETLAARHFCKGCGLDRKIALHLARCKKFAALIAITSRQTKERLP